MHITEILLPEAVKTIATVSSKKRLFQEIADLAASSNELPSDLIFDALQERENLGPTGVGHGVALPHARLDCLDHVVAVFMRVEKAIEFEAADRQPVDLFFALFAPADAGVDHLKALALVSRTMRNSDVCAKLRANGDPAALHAILTEGPSSQAA
jgi:PTS system nitrogen regulatory IIA component